MRANIFSKLKKIAISSIAVIITTQSICFAGFTDAQKQEIINFANKVKGMNTAYTCRGAGLAEALNAGYNLQESSGEYRDRDGNLMNSGTYIWLCCATWVSCILKQCFDIEIGGNRNVTDAYVGPGGQINPLFEEVAIGDPYQVGDIMLGGDWGDGSYGHVWMYLGEINGQQYMTDCTSSDYHEYGNGKNTYGGVYVRPLRNPEIVIRYKGNATSTGKAPNDLTPAFDKIKSNWFYKKVPFRHVSRVEENKTFEYQGIGKVESKTTTEVKNNNILESVTAGISWIMSKLSDLIEWIFNFIITVIKGIIVGFGTIIQMLVSYFMDTVAGKNVEDMSKTFSGGMMDYLATGNLKKALTNSVTLEKIVYNQVPLLDTDVFNGNMAGGEKLANNSFVIMVRNTVAGLYNTMRTASLIGMLLALIYYGVKFAASGAAEAKAEYKQKLANWAIGFFIVFGLHYFLLIVMKLNELAVSTLMQVGKNITSGISRRSIL